MSNTNDISDGYHTFGELYEHRHALFLAVCRAYPSWKSRLHSDGSNMPGWFIAGVDTPAGMVTYHIPDAWWFLYDIQELGRAPEWDGHTSYDAIDRLETLRP